MIVDAWIQHPTLRHISDPMFETLRRWTKAGLPTKELPVAVTIAAMDAAAVSKALTCAWVAPHRVMISNDEVAGFVAQASDRLVGVGSSTSTPRPTPRRAIRRRWWTTCGRTAGARCCSAATTR